MDLRRWWPDVRPGPLLAVLAWAVALWLFGPWMLLAGAGLLAVPRARWWLRPARPWRVAGAVVACLVLVVGLVRLLPDGVLPIPPGAGRLAAPAYVGRAALPQPVTGYDVPDTAGLASNGTGSRHHDGWSSDAYRWAGPLGDRVEVDTASYGIEECATLTVDSQARLVALCGDLRGPSLHVIHPESMRKLASRDLPDRPDTEGVQPWEDPCGGATLYLDEHDRAVVATTDRRLLVLRTQDEEGDPVLAEVDAFDLTGHVPAGDCLVALAPGPGARTWFATRRGLVGFVVRGTGRVRTHDLGEQVTNSLSVDTDGGVFLVSDRAAYRLDVRGGRPAVTWRQEYARGGEAGPGRLTGGSGTTPTLLEDGMLAIADHAEPRMNVLFLHRASGREICRAPVFEAGASATESSLVGLGRGVVVENNHGYAGPWSTLLGTSTAGGLARVDVAGGECDVRWTSDAVAPTSVPKVSLPNGLLYAWTKPARWSGVAAWYLTALDVRTGRQVFSVRTGIGALANNHYSALTLHPDGGLYTGTLGGLVRVRDRR